MTMHTLTMSLFVATIMLTGQQTVSPETSTKLFLWDGETQKVGVGWVSPSSEKMSAGVQDKDGVSKSRTAMFHLAQPNTFVECGWQWANWFPTFAGTDFSSFDTLNVSLRFEGPRKPDDLLLSLASPGDHHCTGRVRLKKYDANLTDGKWHTLSIPLADLYAADRKELETRFPGSIFDNKHTIQVILGTWNGDGDFTVYLDDLSLTIKSTKK